METRVLILPGWLDSLDAHWQTRWERLHGYERVRQHDWQTPRLNDWVATLEAAVAADERPCVLVAHSLGCALAAHWAQRSALAARVRGALLVAPPQIEDRPELQVLKNFAPIPRGRLPFAAIVVASTDDPYGGFEWTRRLAADWGAAFVDAGARGHINGESGLGDWPDGHALIAPWLGDA